VDKLKAISTAVSLICQHYTDEEISEMTHLTTDEIGAIRKLLQ
jgi:hypothetical protein